MTAARPAATSRVQIDYITYMRAVAILIIVAGHTYALAWDHFAHESPLNSVSAFNAIPALITGGTAFFVFVSGFLYRQVFFGRVGYGDFMFKKALYVGLPYLLIAAPITLLEIGFGEFAVAVTKEGLTYPPSIFVDFVVLMTTGRMVTAYWYIPFIFLIFAASPLFDRFIRSGVTVQIALFCAALGTALWLHRPFDNLNPVQSFFYFGHFYLFGILFCTWREQLVGLLRSTPAIVLIGLLLVAIALMQALVFQQVDNLERTGSGWLPQGLDLMLFQKYAAILLLCGVLVRWGGYFHRLLSVIADYSFGIFFLHGVVIAVLNRMPAALSPHLGNPWLDLAMYTYLVFSLSFFLAALAKQILGKRSRYIIGC